MNCITTLSFFVILIMAFISRSVSDSVFIQGPLLMIVLTPIGVKVDITCKVNTSELTRQTSGTFDSISWRTQNQALLSDAQHEVTGGNIRTGTLRVELTEDFTSGVSVQCAAVTSYPLSETLSNTSATLTSYGPPQSPSNITTKLIQVDTLSLSWSAPPSPPTVQLNYTVTVTNTNTSVVRNFTTSNTAITLTRGDVEGDGECDEYVWSVIAVNPAGASDPANHSTPVVFPSAPNDIKPNVCSTYTSITITFKALSCISNDNITYTVMLCTKKTSHAELAIMNELVHFTTSSNCTNITIIAENEFGILIHTVNTSSAVSGDCRSEAPPQISSSAVATRSPSSSPMPTNPAVAIIAGAITGVVLVVVAAVTALTVLLLLVVIRNKQNRDIASNDSQQQEMELKSATISQLPAQSAYMTPADAKEEKRKHEQILYADIGPAATTAQFSEVTNMATYGQTSLQ